MADAPATTDKELLDAWREGDTKAGEVLLERHLMAVYRFFQSQLGQSGLGADPEDLAQRTFEACVTGRDRVHTDFRAYLFGIARHELRREWHRRRTRGEVITPSMAGVFDGRTSPSGAVARSQERETFLRAIDDLPAEHAAVLLRFYWEDRSIQEIAHELGIAIGTVKSRLFRGKALVRDRLLALEMPPDVRMATERRLVSRKILAEDDE
jgi:RNA polymerase sigma-70 factor (ECF subfamily)